MLTLKKRRERAAEPERSHKEDLHSTPPAHPSGPGGSLLHLHKTIGNRGMGALLSGDRPEKSPCSCGGTCDDCKAEANHQKQLSFRRKQSVAAGGLPQLPNWTGAGDGKSHKAMNLPESGGDPAKSQKKISGIDVDKSLCSCAAEIPEKIEWAKLQAKLYSDCAKDPANKTGADVEACNDAELAKRGITTTVAGTTSSTGAVKVAPVKGTCGPIWQKGTELHEAVHHGHQQALEKAFGKGSPAFQSHWNNGQDWGTDEANAYSAEIPFYQAVLAYLQSICGGGGVGFSGWGALIGGLGGAGTGALIGSLFGPVGALVGAAIGGVVGLVAGGFIGGNR